MAENTPEKARNLALRRLSVREYSRLEMSQYLKRKEIPEEVITATVQSLVDEGLLEDERYARMIARHQVLRGKGPMYVLQKLKQKGVRTDLSHVKSLMGQMGDRDELSTARGIVERKYPGFDSDRKMAARAFRALLNRGFSSQVARAAIFGRESNESEAG